MYMMWSLHDQIYIGISVFHLLSDKTPEDTTYVYIKQADQPLTSIALKIDAEIPLATSYSPCSLGFMGSWLSLDEPNIL